MTDSALLSSFRGVEIYDNLVLTEEELIIEGKRCLNLCYIGQKYLTYFSNSFDRLF